MDQFKIDKGSGGITLTYEGRSGILGMETDREAVEASLSPSEMRALAKALTDAAKRAELESVAAFLSGGGA